jgi:hypothetical protein
MLPNDTKEIRKTFRQHSAAQDNVPELPAGQRLINLQTLNLPTEE